MKILLFLLFSQIGAGLIWEISKDPEFLQIYFGLVVVVYVVATMPSPEPPHILKRNKHEI